jgi:hypothetical protein
MPAWSMTLAPTSEPDVFTSVPGSDFAGDRVTFLRLPDGPVVSVFLMDSTFVRLDDVTASR